MAVSTVNKIGVAALAVVAGMGFQAAQAGTVSDYADEIRAIQGKHDRIEFTNETGRIYQSWLSSEERRKWTVEVRGVKFTTILDDGRGTTTKALECGQDKLFGTTPGCPITFDGELRVGLDGGSRPLEHAMTIWNVDFK